ncbi:hypothetical protein UU9_13920 [Rhodanobacter fulvus Jip2]|uniref:Uncharacterized protein n=1 Tax=Rhodanobacter fulvus Jip2 TaxID=1163408 RepID=I4VLG2_9GAMM|nr:hypothetical protein [Rhodanobacter fulvus]EIL88053.1 hypothetical protein UU9_13920 [Rhodanobacter fulvus Jip2]
MIEHTQHHPLSPRQIDLAGQVHRPHPVDRQGTRHPVLAFLPHPKDFHRRLPQHVRHMRLAH